MGLHFHSHGRDKYIDRGREEGKQIGKQEVQAAHNAKNPYDRLNVELEQHILKTTDYVHAHESKKKVSDAALALRQAVHELRHPKKQTTVTIKHKV